MKKKLSVPTFVCMYYKILCAKVTDDDIEAIVADELYKPSVQAWKLKSIHVTAGNLVNPTATVTLIDHEGNEVSEASMGIGPIDAVYQAISAASNARCKLNDFTIHSVKDGAFSALGVVTVRLEPISVDENPIPLEKDDDIADVVVHAQTGMVSNRQFSGRGTDTDIVVASATAYLNAVNRMVAQSQRQRF